MIIFTESMNSVSPDQPNGEFVVWSFEAIGSCMIRVYVNLEAMHGAMLHLYFCWRTV